jgi:hypothetical protein
MNNLTHPLSSLLPAATHATAALAAPHKAFSCFPQPDMDEGGKRNWQCTGTCVTGSMSCANRESW